MRTSEHRTPSQGVEFMRRMNKTHALVVLENNAEKTIKYMETEDCSLVTSSIHVVKKRT